MTTLADAVLPLIRTRADLYRWSLANAHGRDMHEAVDLLEAALPTRAASSVTPVADSSRCTRSRRPLHACRLASSSTG